MFAFGRDMPSPGIVRVDLKADSDLYQVNTAELVSVVPGTIVVDARQRSRILYLHVFLGALKPHRTGDRDLVTDLGIMRHAIDVFRDEGREAVWLGLSPAAGLHRGPFRDSALLHKAMAAGYASPRVNWRIFNFAGIAAYKKRFRGRETPAYVASPPGSELMRLVALLRIVRLI